MFSRPLASPWRLVSVQSQDPLPPSSSTPPRNPTDRPQSLSLPSPSKKTLNFLTIAPSLLAYLLKECNFLQFSRVPREVGSLQSLLPLHSAVSSARLTSRLGIDSSSRLMSLGTLCNSIPGVWYLFGLSKVTVSLRCFAFQFFLVFSCLIHVLQWICCFIIIYYYYYWSGYGRNF